MKNVNLFILSISIIGFLPFSIFSQIQSEAEFKHYQEEYVILSEGINLTEEHSWDYPEWTYFFEEIITDEPIIIPGFNPEHPLDEILLDNYGDIEFELYDWEGGVAYFLWVIGFFGEFSSPLVDSTNTDQGSIIYHFEDGISHLEFRNVAAYAEYEYYGSNLESRFNFQIEVRHSDARVRFKFGPSTISSILDSMLFQEFGLPIGIFLEKENLLTGDYDELVFLLSGDANNPELLVFDEEPNILPDFLSAFPPNGTVYEFNFSEISSVLSRKNTSSDWRIFPNPGRNQLNIALPEDFQFQPNSIIQVYNNAGQLVLMQNTDNTQFINTSELPEGLYFIHLITEKGSDFKKWMKVK